MNNIDDIQNPFSKNSSQTSMPETHFQIDPELIASLEAYVEADPKIEKVASAKSTSILTTLSKSEHVDFAQIWAWQNCKDPQSRLSYGDQDTLDILASKIPSNAACILFVTDDAPPPWPSFAGPFQALSSLLANHRYFEFLLVGKDLIWYVFDTHMNELVFGGSNTRLNTLCNFSVD